MTQDLIQVREEEETDSDQFSSQKKAAGASLFAGQERHKKTEAGCC